MTFPCELEIFTINSKEASSIDFGDTFDHKKEENTYGCNNKYFEPEPPNRDSITQIQYHKGRKIL